MKNTLLLAVTYLLYQNIFAQAPEVKNLHYTFEQSSYNRKKEVVEETHEVNFYADDNMLIAERSKGKDAKPLPLYMFYFEKDASVIIMPNRKDYVVDPLDSAFQNKQELQPTGNTKVVNGYNCTEYTMTRNRQYTALYEMPPIIYEFKVWITKDINFRADYNPYVIALLNYDHLDATSNFEGVIVQLEGTFTFREKVWKFNNTLDKTKFNSKPTIPVLPWLDREPGNALLQGIWTDGPGGKGEIKRTHLEVISNMQRDFLFKVVGNENVKFQRSLGVTSYLNPWW